MVWGNVDGQNDQTLVVLAQNGRSKTTFILFDHPLSPRFNQITISICYPHIPNIDAISGALITLSLSIFILNSQCEEGAREVDNKKDVNITFLIGPFLGGACQTPSIISPFFDPSGISWLNDPPEKSIFTELVYIGLGRISIFWGEKFIFELTYEQAICEQHFSGFKLDLRPEDFGHFYTVRISY